MFLIAIALATSTSPERWVEVGMTDGSREYLDRASVTRNGTKVTLWKQRQLPSNSGFVWTELELDCSRRTDTLLAWVRDEDGAVTHNAVRPHREAAPIVAGTAEETIFNLVCR
jgi:hypothetical protein